MRKKCPRRGIPAGAIAERGDLWRTPLSDPVKKVIIVPKRLVNIVAPASKA